MCCLRVLATIVLLVHSASLFAAASAVSVSGRQLIVRKRLGDGSLGAAAPYVVRGVVWAPASVSTNTSPSDPNNAAVRRLEFSQWVDTDVPLLAAMHVNTVRLLIDPGTDTSGTEVLDQLYANGIMVIMTVDNAVNDLTRVSQVVNYYKDHPAVLMWMIGNEWNIFLYYGVASSVADAAQRTQTAAALIKSIDSAHPVGTSYGDIDINTAGKRLSDTQNYVNNICTSVDVWALNIYRGNSFGNLFTQWASISTKPMFLGEFGTDAFRSAGSTSAGSIDEPMQSDWNMSLWDEIFVNLSKNVPEAVALGGTPFEFNDEWWKVSPAGSQQSGGYAGAQPDGFANEEYFGLFNIGRQARAAVATTTAAFDESYQPPRTHSYRVISRGYLAQEYSYQYGTSWIFKDGAKVYSAIGGGGGGRGFSIAVFDPATNTLQQPVQHFDTYRASHGGTGEFCSMNTFLDSLPNGSLVLMGVADEAGLNGFPPNSCQLLNTSCLSGTLQRLDALGSQRIRDYCYGGSWAFAAVKGEGARAEAVGSGVEAQARTTLPVVTRTLTITSVGSGSIDAVPVGVGCGAGCTTFPGGTNALLYPVPNSGWVFSFWSGDCAGSTTPCSVAMDSNRSVSATFVLVPSKVAISSITPPSPAAGSAFSVMVEAQDEGGNPANVIAPTVVQLSRTSGTGTLSGTISGTIAAGTSSVTIAGVTYTKAESGVVVTATRTSGDLLASGDSAAFTVVAGPAANLAVLAIAPPSPAAGSAFSVTVEAQDDGGNPADVIAPTAIQLSRKSGTGTLGGTISGTIAAGTSSVTIAGVTYTKAESGVVITATRTSGDVLASGDSAAFTVVAGPATNLAILSITPPSPAAGSAFSVTVEAQDDDGNPANVIAPTVVHLSRTSGTGTLSGTISGTIAAGTGSVTIADVTYTRAESGVVVTATRTSGDLLASGDSAAFTVVAGPAANLAVLAIAPPSPAAGSAFSVTVEAQDDDGNPANVIAQTVVQLSRTNGAGTLSGTISGTIAAGTSSVTIAGVTYTKAESGVVITATRTSGDLLAAGDSAAFTVIPYPPTSLYIVTPCRVLDTRNTSPLPNLATRDVQIGGVCGIPLGAVAVVANITAVTPASNGFLAFYPTGSTWPGNSTINYRTAKTRANNTILTLSVVGATTVMNSGPTQDFIVDVTGYFQ